MANGIRIDELDATVLPSRDHVVPAMKDGLTVKLTVGQILDLLGKVLDPDEVGSRALFAALNLSDLDDPEQARENLGATEVGDALFTAADAAAARAGLGATAVGDELFTAADQAAARNAIGIDYWQGKTIGEPFPLWDHMTGVPIPPKGQFIKLTAGLTGAGEYNEGVLTSESVSGSAPLIVATAVIDLSASPLDGETINLINTERRFLRPGTTSGVTEDFALQGHYHRSFEGPAATAGNSGGNNVYPATRASDFNTRWNAAAAENNVVVRGATTDSAYGTVLVSTETRPRNIRATYYMRIL